MDPDKRNICAIRLRGEKSDGLFLPLESLASFGDITKLKEGDKIDIFNGTEICCKYIPRRNSSKREGNGGKGNRTRKRSFPIAPLFREHADTEQLAYKCGDLVELTLEAHGSSGRTALVPKLAATKKNLFDKIFHREGKPVYEWDYVSGTRRVVLDDFSGGYYGNDSFRKTHHDFFVGKLLKGETVYYEIVGYTDTGIPIMPSADNKKTQDKEFIKKYGKTTEFSYGCSPCGEDGKPTSDIYVYRMTMTNEDGDVVEYAPDFMRYRCEQMGAKYVPVLWRGIIPPDVNAGEFINNLAEHYNDGADPIGKTHVREGVVARIINRPKFTAYKSKNFSFKILSNIAVANAEASGALDNMSEDELSEM